MSDGLIWYNSVNFAATVVELIVVTEVPSRPELLEIKVTNRIRCVGNWQSLNTAISYTLRPKTESSAYSVSSRPKIK